MQKLGSSGVESMGQCHYILMFSLQEPMEKFREVIRASGFFVTPDLKHDIAWWQGVVHVWQPAGGYKVQRHLVSFIGGSFENSVPLLHNDTWWYPERVVTDRRNKWLFWGLINEICRSVNRCVQKLTVICIGNTHHSQISLKMVGPSQICNTQDSINWVTSGQAKGFSFSFFFFLVPAPQIGECPLLALGVMLAMSHAFIYRKFPLRAIGSKKGSHP